MDTHTQRAQMFEILSPMTAIPVHLVGSPLNVSVHLVDTSGSNLTAKYEDQVEIQYRGLWGTICNLQWTIDDQCPCHMQVIDIRMYICTISKAYSWHDSTSLSQSEFI